VIPPIEEAGPCKNRRTTKPWRERLDERFSVQHWQRLPQVRGDRRVIGKRPSDQNHKPVSGVIEGIDEEATLSLLDKKQVVHREKITASD
jgi:hypothetical protein